MKLKFWLGGKKLEALYRVLRIMSQVWKTGEEVYMYFTDSLIVIYPRDCNSFNNIYGRVHLQPLLIEGGTIEAVSLDTACAQRDMPTGVSTQYFWESKQVNNAILLSPHKMVEFMDCLKVFTENHWDAYFKLKQEQKAGEVRRFLDVKGFENSGALLVNWEIPINVIYEVEDYPEGLKNEEATFSVDAMISEYFFHKFLYKLNLSDDNDVTLKFDIPVGGTKWNQDRRISLTTDMLESSIKIPSSNQSTLRVTWDKEEDQHIEQTQSGYSEHKVVLSKRAFLKLFNIVKLEGWLDIGITHQSKISISYESDDKLSLYMFAPSS